MLATAHAQSLTARGELPQELRPGDSSSMRLEIRLDDPGAAVERAVLFLNVVADDAAANYPQAAHLVFSGASEEPALFRRVLSGTELRDGVATLLNFDASGRAPPGEYVLVLQLFAGEGTNPHRVRLEDRIGIVSFPFRVVAAGQ